MAFFGLSALGPQNCFAAARPETYNCTLFDIEEFEVAFDRTDKEKSGSLSLAQVQRAMELVFHGPLPEFENKRVMDAFSALDTPSVTKAAFLSTLRAVRVAEEEPLDTTHTAHYNSYREFRAGRLRERRASLGPPEMFAKSLTSLQDIGWKHKEPSLGFERAVRLSCAETKFAGELWKAGYM